MNPAVVLILLAQTLDPVPVGSAGPDRFVYQLDPRDSRELAYAEGWFEAASEHRRKVHEAILMKFGNGESSSGADWLETKECAIKGSYVVCVKNKQILEVR